MTRRGCSHPAEPSADIDDLLCILRDDLGKADAFITTAEALIVQSWHDDGDGEDNDNDDSVLQRRNQVEYLVEAAKLAVRADEHTGRELKALAQRHRRARRVLPGDELRAFLSRMLGWSDERAVEVARRSLALALDHRAALVLCGERDMVPLALALHRRTLGAEKPFIVCDPHV